jgi:hypothetical protein
MAMSRLVPLLEFNQRWVNAVETSKDFRETRAIRDVRLAA